jgi:predicted nucleic acid-binding protein
MPGRHFLDTNILLYLYSEDEPDKQAVARTLTIGDRPWISTQVLCEMANVLRRKFGLEYSNVAAAIEEVRSACEVATITVETIARALELGSRYRYSFFDSLIIAAALECGCDTLVSEDFQHGFVAESRLTIRNPFK